MASVPGRQATTSVRHAPEYDDERDDATDALAAEVTYLKTGETVRVPPGRAVLECALDQGIEMEHGCRVGVCGACAVEIVEGLEHVDPPDPIEEDSIRRFGLPVHCRLACRFSCRGPLVVKPAEG
jgi:ferredoxin